MLKMVGWVGGALVLAVLVLSRIDSSDPRNAGKTEARRTIDYCWEQQSRKSLDDYAKRLHAAECERMESDFQAKYGVKP